MLQQERLGDRQEALRVVLDARQVTIHTGFPGIVVSYDAEAMTGVIQPAIMAQVRDLAGVWRSVALPLLLDCPVYFPSGGGFTATFPVAVGDEVWVSLAERCIDGWWQSGGVQPQAELRMHDLSDGFFFPKVWSQPKKLSPPPSTTGAQLRTDDGTAFFELTSNGSGGWLARVQAATIELHATFQYRWDVNGYGQQVTYEGANVWQIDNYQTAVAGQTVNTNNHDINPPEIP